MAFVMMNFFKFLCCVSIVVGISIEKGEFCDSACGLVALIPARGGSKGIPYKNLVEIDGESLLCRTISTVAASRVFDAIWVSTDVDPIANEAKKCGAEVHWRSADSATDTASTLSVVQDFLTSHSEIRAIGVVQCTSPFLCPEDLKNALKIFKTSATDCVFSATRSFKLRWKISPSGYGLPENFDPKVRPRRQDWPGELQETGMFYIATKGMIEYGVLQNNRCRILEVPANRSLEIDTALDLEIARMIAPMLGKC